MKSFEQQREEIILLNKNGVNFLVAASICWLIITVIWYLPYSTVSRAYFTFYASMPMLPLAFLFSKVFGTSWKIPDNPLNDLGLWLNLAQLFYFPFIFIMLGQNPLYMPMALAIITGAHFFPYAWFYQSKGFAVMAGVIAIGTTLIGTSTRLDTPPLWTGLFMVVSLWVLALWVYRDYKKVLYHSTLSSRAPAEMTAPGMNQVF
ncbi:DUF7010 family protein [Telluribacter sp. SYSU D00476]|uniref:DUF7010 family protein n=1 Tax=Telluribacter sp. SYSU D00476 TaxID=2811430 RepID=UPI001FF29CAB|nr:hypothetical protein [Telluribacter sp. SYSU D00476]